jgi:hypothetical protein
MDSNWMVARRVLEIKEPEEGLGKSLIDGMRVIRAQALSRVRLPCHTWSSPLRCVRSYCFFQSGIVGLYTGLLEELEALSRI